MVAIARGDHLCLFTSKALNLPGTWKTECQLILECGYQSLDGHGSDCHTRHLFLGNSDKDGNVDDRKLRTRVCRYPHGSSGREVY